MSEENPPTSTTSTTTTTNTSQQQQKFILTDQTTPQVIIQFLQLNKDDPEAIIVKENIDGYTVKNSSINQLRSAGISLGSATRHHLDTLKQNFGIKFIPYVEIPYHGKGKQSIFDNWVKTSGKSMEDVHTKNTLLSYDLGSIEIGTNQENKEVVDAIITGGCDLIIYPRGGEATFKSNIIVFFEFKVPTFKILEKAPQFFFEILSTSLASSYEALGVYSNLTDIWMLGWIQGKSIEYCILRDERNFKKASRFKTYPATKLQVDGIYPDYTELLTISTGRKLMQAMNLLKLAAEENLTGDLPEVIEAK
eukprot:gene8269-10161_t